MPVSSNHVRRTYTNNITDPIRAVLPPTTTTRSCPFDQHMLFFAFKIASLRTRAYKCHFQTHCPRSLHIEDYT